MRHRADLVEKAVQMANWRGHRASQDFLTKPVKFEDESVNPGQRLWFCNAISSLTREEVIALYDNLIENAKSENTARERSDFTSADVRAMLPHIYGEQP